MNTLELLLIAIGLSMDAFAVAVCCGLSMEKTSLKDSAVVGVYFGAFQAIMPLVGYALGFKFAPYIEDFDHWIAFALLTFIGARMIRESFVKTECNDTQKYSLKPAKMLLLAFATSIDALAVGISFAFLSVRILPASGLIGAVTLLLSMLGVKLGTLFGLKFKARAELAGGVILILIGLKILLEHIGVLVF